MSWFVCAGLTSGVCLQMLLRVLEFVGYISRAAFLEGEALWCWTPSWMDSLFCSGQQQHLCLLHCRPLQHLLTTVFSVWLYLAAMGWLTCISSHIQSTAPELFPRMPNARTRLHISRPFLQQTERNRLSWQTEFYIHGGLNRLERSPTCIDLSYQRFAPFFSRPPPCSISRALLVSLASRPLGSSRHITHRQLSIRARESLLVWSG